MIRKYHNHTLQNNPQHLDEEPQRHQEDKQTEETSSPPDQDICKTRKETNKCTIKHGTNKQN